MKEQLIDILAENIQELEKEEIVSALEIPKKSDMGDFAFPCFKLAKIYRKAPNMIAEDLTKQILEKNYEHPRLNPEQKNSQQSNALFRCVMKRICEKSRISVVSMKYPLCKITGMDTEQKLFQKR